MTERFWSVTCWITSLNAEPMNSPISAILDATAQRSREPDDVTMLQGSIEPSGLTCRWVFQHCCSNGTMDELQS